MPPMSWTPSTTGTILQGMPHYDLPLADLRNHRCSRAAARRSGRVLAGRAGRRAGPRSPTRCSSRTRRPRTAASPSTTSRSPAPTGIRSRRGSCARAARPGGCRAASRSSATAAVATCRSSTPCTRPPATRASSWTRARRAASGRSAHTPDPGAGFSGPEHPGVLTRGVLDPETYYFRRLYVDAVRAVETAAAHPQVDADRIACRRVAGRRAVAGGGRAGAGAGAPLPRRHPVPVRHRARDHARTRRAVHGAGRLPGAAHRPRGRRRAHPALHRQRAAGAAHPVPDADLVRPDGHDLPALDGVRRLQRDHGAARTSASTRSRGTRRRSRTRNAS